MHTSKFNQVTCKLCTIVIFVFVMPSALLGQDGQKGQVIVANGSLDLRTELTKENVKIEIWPAEIIPPDAITNLKEVTDMVTLIRLADRMPILKNAIRHKDVQSHTLKIPRNMKVVAVRMSGDDTIGSLLEPGNRVDVIGVTKRRDRDNNKLKTHSQTFLKAIQVYSVSRKSKAGTIVGLLVTEAQSEALVFVHDSGSLKLVLRGDDVEFNGEVGSLNEFRKIVEEKDIDVFNELKDLRALVDDQQRVIREFRKRLERLENDEASD